MLRERIGLTEEFNLDLYDVSLLGNLSINILVHSSYIDINQVCFLACVINYSRITVASISIRYKSENYRER